MYKLNNIEIYKVYFLKGCIKNLIIFIFRPELKPIEKETVVTLKLPEVDKLNPPILQLDEASFWYHAGQVIFENVCLNARMDSRICIVSFVVFQ